MAHPPSIADRHMGQETRSRAAPLDRARRQRGLDEPVAAGAGQPRADDAVHDKPARDILEFFGDVFADPAQAPATIDTGVRARRQFHLHPGNVIRDRTTLGFVLLLDVRQTHPRGHRGGSDLAGLKGKLKLFRCLGRGPEPVRAVPCQLMPELLDQDRLRLHFGQKPRGEAAKLLGVFRQGQGLIQHSRSLSHCIRCGNR